MQAMKLATSFLSFFASQFYLFIYLLFITKTSIYKEKGNSSNIVLLYYNIQNNNIT